MLYEEPDSKKKRAVYLAGIMLLSDGHRRDEKKIVWFKEQAYERIQTGSILLDLPW